MPTYRIDTMSVELSKRIGDEVSAYNTEGSLYTSAQRLAALNAARQKIYAEIYEKFADPEKFALAFPEFLLETDTGNTVTDSVGSRVPNARYFLSVKLNITVGETTVKKLCRRIPPSLFYEMEEEPEACPAPTSADDMGFIDNNNEIKFYGASGETYDGDYNALYLKDIVDTAYQAAIPDPEFWQEQTIEAAAEIIQTFAKLQK